MNQGIIKVVAISILVLFTALYLGSASASDNTLPFAIICGVLSIFVLISLREKVVYTYLFLPILSGTGISVFRPDAIYFVAVLIISPAYAVAVLTGKCKMTWRSLGIVDCAVGLLILWICVQGVRFPVTMAIFDDHSEYVYGKAYYEFWSAGLFYIAISTIRVNIRTLMNTFRYMFITQVFVGLLQFARNPSITGSGTTQVSEQSYHYVLRFAPIFSPWFSFLLSKYRIREIVCSIWRLPLFMTAFYVGGAYGRRSELIIHCLTIAGIIFIRRQYFILVALPLLSLLTLFTAVNMGEPTSWPYGLQRAITVIPGISKYVDPEIAEAAESSSNWRKRMWELALAPHKAYIQDKVFGDGFCMPRKVWEIATYDSTRGDNMEAFAATAIWHSLPVSAIHHLGYVGLFFVVLVVIVLVFYGLKTCRIWLLYKGGWGPVCFLILPIMRSPSELFVAGDVKMFAPTIAYLAIIKLLYTTAIESGIYNPKAQRQTYTPILMRNAPAAPQELM